MHDSFRSKITREERGGRALAVVATVVALLALAHVGLQELDLDTSEPVGIGRHRGAPGREPARPAQMQSERSEPSVGAAALRDGEALNLNSATEADLTLLPGIGPAIAGRIVAHRDAQGPFQTVAGLEAVRGVGPRTRARIEPLVTVVGSSE